MPRSRKAEMTNTPENQPEGYPKVPGTPIAQASEIQPGEEGILFPELDVSNPQHKALFAAAKKFAKAKSERDAVLSTQKEKVDAAGAKVIALLHECSMTKFKHKGVEAEIFAPEEKITVKVESGDDEPEDD